MSKDNILGELILWQAASRVPIWRDLYAGSFVLAGIPWTLVGSGFRLVVQNLKTFCLEE
jgi:hypothetical protein